MAEYRPDHHRGEELGTVAQPVLGHGMSLEGRYLDKKEALAALGRMGIAWSKRQVDWTAEPDHQGNRRWPWFLDDKGVLRIDAGFIHRHFEAKQLEALRRWREGPYIE